MRRFLRKAITEARLHRVGLRRATNGCWRYQLPDELIGTSKSQSFLQLLERCEEGGGWSAEIHSSTFDPETGDDVVSSVCLPRAFHTVHDVYLLLEAVGGPRRSRFAEAMPGKSFRSPRRRKVELN